VASQKLDPLDLGIEGRLLQRKLLLEIPTTCWHSSGKHQVVVGVSPHGHLVLPPVVPLAWANSHNIRNWAPSSELEVVCVNQVCPLLDPTQHVEQPKERDGQPHADEHVTEVDKDHHQDEGVW
jgi:hypothetical protein